MLIYWDLANKSGLDKAPELQPWPLPGGAYPVSHVHGNNQYSQTLQQPNSAQSAALLSGVYTSVPNYTPLYFDPIIQVPWRSSGMQPLGNIPSQGYAEQSQVLQYEPYVLPTPTIPLVPEASSQSCQSYISQREDPKGKQIAVLQPESEKAVAIPAVADFNNATTQPSTKIRSVRYI